MSVHGPVIALQTLKVCLGQWPSFSGMELCILHASAVHVTTGLVRGVMGRENWQ